MQICDFARSYVRWRIDFEKMDGATVTLKQPLTLNNVRVPVECVVEIVEVSTGNVVTYVLGASCKTERVNATSDIWSVPNADFNPIFSSADEYMNIKFFDHAGKTLENERTSERKTQDRLVGQASSAFDTHSIDLHRVPGRVVDSVDDLIDVLKTNTPVVSHTEYSNDRYKVQVQYPVKAMNTSERENFYQVDTGPVLYVDLDNWPGENLDPLHLAYIAHNCDDWAEFLVNVPTQLENGTIVHHYSKSVHVKTIKNMVLEVND